MNKKTQSKPNPTALGKCVAGGCVRRASVSGWAMLLAIAIQAGNLPAQVLTDPGFESYGVSSGGYLKPVSGPWWFVQNAGVVEPYSPPSAIDPTTVWSATFFPMEGQQYASTYAGGDYIEQQVFFETAGLYTIIAYAAAPTGTVVIPLIGGGSNTLPLGSGEFMFTLDTADIGSPHSIAAGTTWTAFSADFAIATPGNYRLGVRNTKIAPYFINYDAFAIQAVPEASSWILLAIGMGAFLLFHLRRPHSVERIALTRDSKAGDLPRGRHYRER